jgi:hypothetical protein
MKRTPTSHGEARPAGRRLLVVAGYTKCDQRLKKDEFEVATDLYFVAVSKL